MELDKDSEAGECISSYGPWSWAWDSDAGECISSDSPWNWTRTLMLVSASALTVYGVLQSMGWT